MVRLVADHWGNERKMSMRIKVRNGESIMGMSKFSIQSASQRSYQHEPLMLDMMRRVGLIAPRYTYADVRLNGRVVGIMALEEHFTKEMLEFNHRREGPVVATDMGWMWEQANRNYNDGGSRDRETNLFDWDYPIKAYQLGKFDPSTARSASTSRALSLLRDYRDSTVSGDRTFDLDLLSRWWIVVNIWQTWHSLELHNRRDYFNPITGKLEPVAYDNSSWLSLNQTWKLLLSDEIRSVLTNQIFRHLTIRNIDLISQLINSNEFESWFDHKHKTYVDVISIDGSVAPPLTVNQLQQSLGRFSDEVNHLFFLQSVDVDKKERISVTTETTASSHQDLTKAQNDPVRTSQFQKDDRLLIRHVRPFWFWTEDSITVEIKNLTSSPITLGSLYRNKRPETNFLSVFGDIQIPAFSEVSNNHVVELSLSTLSGLTPDDNLMIDYWYRERKYTRRIFHQFRNHFSGYEGDDATRSWLEILGAKVDPVNREITFPSGEYRVDRRIETLPGWAVKFLPGATLNFNSGGALKINGALLSMGTKANPVNISITSKLGAKPLGAWGGVLVTNARTDSVLQHTNVSGNLEEPLPVSQDAFGLTGCITFYNSRVLITDSSFKNLQCEDAVNIIRSSFNLSNNKFVTIRSDALDSDFSTGSITKSSFLKIGGDGVDLAGSRVEIRNLRLRDILDKACSVGEGSVARIDNVEISEAAIGVASKDRSQAIVRNSHFKKIRDSSLMAYVKKEEYGPAQLLCIECFFDSDTPKIYEQFPSEITIDDDQVIPASFNSSGFSSVGQLH